MSSEEISVGGLQYVSSKRASDISGYAQDYIGQLARSGQIDAKRMGGLWYVYMESLEKYKSLSPEIKINQANSLKESNEQETEIPLIFNGKNYISANRASKITGYNQDYVGQLARSGKILSRQVGNRWYIDQEAIIQHKKEKDSLLAAVQAESVGIAQAAVIDLPEKKIEAPVGMELLSYVSDNRDLHPNINHRSIDQHRSLDVPIRQVQAPISESAPVYSSEKSEIPIKVIRKSTVVRHTAQQNAPLYRINHDVRQYKPNKSGSRILGISILGITAAIGAGFLFLTKGTNTGTSSQVQIVMTAAISSISDNIALSSLESYFENLVSPELIYNRSK